MGSALVKQAQGLECKPHTSSLQEKLQNAYYILNIY
jgi:hypothetical protein